jgi:hypothetical protein
MTFEYFAQPSDLQEGGTHERGDDAGRDGARIDGPR